MPILKPDMQIFDNTSEESDSTAKFDSMKRKQKIRLENKPSDRMYSNGWINGTICNWDECNWDGP